MIAPSGGATATGESGSVDPAFFAVSADQVVASADGSRASTRPSANRTAKTSAARAATTSSIQILQTWKGIQGAGQQGVSIAAGPAQVVQTVSDGSQGVIRAFVKSTGVRPKNASKTLLQFFNLSNPVTVSQASVVYDPVGKRFIAVAAADNSGDLGLVMRISKGTAATPLTKKKWLKPVEFAFSTSQFEEAGRTDADESMPLIGVSSDKIAITAVADDPNDAAVANRIFIFPKAPYYKAANYKPDGELPGGWASSVNNTYDGQAPAVNATKQSNVFIAIPDTSDVTVATYTGAAKDNPPKFSIKVVFPTTPLVAPPLVSQSGGDDLDVGGLAFTGVAWRRNNLYAATTVTCDLDPAAPVENRACVRVFGINTGSGVPLASDKTLRAAAGSGTDWFNPDLAIDGAGNVLLAANDEGSDIGPSLAVFAKKGKKWVAPKFIALATDVINLPGDPVAFRNTTGAALDPTSPWDVWVAGSVGNSGVSNGLSTTIARVSLAKNKATIKASSTKVRKGNKVTFTVKLARPDSKNTIRGLPVALQRAPRSGGSFATIKSGQTAANGTAQWRVKVKKATRYRTLGKAVAQSGGQGRVFARVTSKPVTVTLR